MGGFNLAEGLKHGGQVKVEGCVDYKNKDETLTKGSGLIYILHLWRSHICQLQAEGDVD